MYVGRQNVCVCKQEAEDGTGKDFHFQHCVWRVCALERALKTGWDGKNWSQKGQVLGKEKGRVCILCVPVYDFMHICSKDVMRLTFSVESVTICENFPMTSVEDNPNGKQTL